MRTTSFFICLRDPKKEMTTKLIEFADLDLARHWALKYEWVTEENFLIMEAAASPRIARNASKNKPWWKSSWEITKKPRTQKTIDKLERVITPELCAEWDKKKLARGN